MRIRSVVTGFLLAAGLAVAADKQRTVKPGFNFFSVDQDVKLGQEAAQQVAQQFEIVNDSKLNETIQRIGANLERAAGKQPFHFTFKVVNDKSINAFALPGGPMFINTGLIAAADNEAQLAGVMAHEMSHVILRHGTNQASKANLIQIPAMLAGGLIDNGGMLGQLAQLGIGLGANSVLLSYSRNAERDADLNGARMMSAAGYNPLELAHFFEKLQAESGKSNLLTKFFSDHPDPGNRIGEIESDMKFYPRRNYTTGGADFASVKSIAKDFVSRAKPPKQAQAQPAQGAVISTTAPSGFEAYQGPFYAIAYPRNWNAARSEDGVNARITAPDGLPSENNVSHGVIVTIAPPKTNDFAKDNASLIDDLVKNYGLRNNGEARSLRVDNHIAMLTPLEGKSSNGTNQREMIWVLTVGIPKGLFNAVFVAPESGWGSAQNEYEQMIQSLRF